MERFVIEVETTNPYARERIRAVVEDTLRGVDLDEQGRCHPATITATDEDGNLIWQTNLDPDEETE